VPAAREPHVDPIVEIRGVTKRFGDVVALDDVTLVLSGPRLVAVLGPNGAGKTTLLDLACGLSEPTAGSIRLFGQEIGQDDYPRRRVGVVMPREFVFDGVNVGDYADLFASIYGTKDGRARIVSRARLEGRERVSVERLSGGEAQRLFIAAASVHDPELLLLDEPTGELDPENKLRVGELLEELAERALVVMTTHDLDEAERLADEVLFLFDGRVRAHGTKASLLRETSGEATLRDAFFRFCGTTISRKGEAL
jgi:ABC-2 type transport system ATP-binding protein